MGENMKKKGIIILFLCFFILFIPFKLFAQDEKTYSNSFYFLYSELDTVNIMKKDTTLENKLISLSQKLTPEEKYLLYKDKKMEGAIWYSVVNMIFPGLGSMLQGDFWGGFWTMSIMTVTVPVLVDIYINTNETQFNSFFYNPSKFNFIYNFITMLVNLGDYADILYSLLGFSIFSLDIFLYFNSILMPFRFEVKYNSKLQYVLSLSYKL